jgi:hypothetical protein
MNKERIILILDVGSSMNKTHPNLNKTLIRIAIETI